MLLNISWLILIQVHVIHLQVLPYAFLFLSLYTFCFKIIEIFRNQPARELFFADCLSLPLKKMKEVYENQKKILQEDIRILHTKIIFTADIGEEKNLLDTLKSKEEKLLNISEGYVKHINALINEIKNSEQYLKLLISQRDKKERELKGLNLEIDSNLHNYFFLCIIFLMYNNKKY